MSTTPTQALGDHTVQILEDPARFTRERQTMVRFDDQEAERLGTSPTLSGGDATNSRDHYRPSWLRLAELAKSFPFGQQDKVPDDDRFDNFRHSQVEDFREGYPRLAAFNNSDPNFAVYRRFGYLRKRLILHKAVELSVLERELNTLDAVESETQNIRLSCAKDDLDDPESKRTNLLRRIQNALKDYDELVAAEQRSLAAAKPTKQNHRSVANYLWNERSLVFEELEYINCADDLICLTNEQDTPLHKFIEWCLQRWPLSWLQVLFTSRAEPRKSSDEAIIIFSKGRIQAFISVWQTLFLIVMLMIPVILLKALDMDTGSRLILVALFMVGFTVIVSLSTSARPHEIFAATVAYSAVLVVFLGGVSTAKSA